MSSRHKIQDATGVIVDNQPAGRLYRFGTAVPTAGESGNMPGCLYQRVTSGQANGLYINAGTATSATWIPIDTNATSALGFLPLKLTDWRLVASNDVANLAAIGGVLAVDSSPVFMRANAATDKALRIKWASSTSIEIFTQYFYPPDMDVTATYSINCRIAKSANTDATCTFTVGCFEGIGDTNRGSATAVLAQSALTTYTCTVTPTTGHPNFANITLVPGTHTTDDIYLYEAYVLYKKKSLTT